MKLADNANGFSLHWSHNEFVLYHENAGEVARLAAFTRLDKALHYATLKAICFENFKTCPVCAQKINNHYNPKNK